MDRDFRQICSFPISNAELIEFTRLVDLNHDQDLDRLSPENLKRLTLLRDRLLGFLWDAVRELTGDLEIARHACLGARDVFFEYVGFNGKDNPLKKAVRERLIFRLQTRRTWLLRKLRERVAEALECDLELTPIPRALVELRSICQARCSGYASAVREWWRVLLLRVDKWHF